jgi:hypothetical protein
MKITEYVLKIIQITVFKIVIIHRHQLGVITVMLYNEQHHSNNIEMINNNAEYRKNVA